MNDSKSCIRYVFELAISLSTSYPFQSARNGNLAQRTAVADCTSAFNTLDEYLFFYECRLISNLFLYKICTCVGYTCPRVADDICYQFLLQSVASK